MFRWIDHERTDLLCSLVDENNDEWMVCIFRSNGKFMVLPRLQVEDFDGIETLDEAKALAEMYVMGVVDSYVIKEFSNA